MESNVNAINWFEIPATDIDRAKSFYETILAASMGDVGDMMGMKMVSFPMEMGNGKVSGALVQSPYHTPAQVGTTVYLNANPEIQTVIDRIEAAGGTVVMPRTLIAPEIGYMAFFTDTEGNKVALHAQN